MKVFATVPEHEVEVSIDTDEIAAALHGQPNEKCTLVLNSVAKVLRAISDFQIREQMLPAQRSLIGAFLAEQAERYAHANKEQAEEIKALRIALADRTEERDDSNRSLTSALKREQALLARLAECEADGEAMRQVRLKLYEERDQYKARLADATALIDEAYYHGDTDDWGARAYAFLRPADGAPAATCKHGEAGSCVLCDEEDREHDQAMADSADAQGEP